MKTNPYAIAFAAIATLTAASTTFAQDLSIQNFLAKPEHFGVTSTLIEGDKEVLLVNAQFSKSEALRFNKGRADSRRYASSRHGRSRHCRR